MSYTTPAIPNAAAAVPVKWSGDASANSAGSASAIPMNNSAMQLLADAVSQREQKGGESNGGASGYEPVLTLTPPTLTIQEARIQLVDVANRLPIVLGALLGSTDPITAEQGAALKAVENTASQLSARVIADGAVEQAGHDEVTGADAAGSEQQVNPGAWLASNRFAILLELLRQVLLELAAMERTNSANSLEMKREQTQIAGKLMVEQSNTNFTGALTGTLVSGVVSGAALNQTFKSVDMQTKSTLGNSLKATKTDISLEDSNFAMKANSTPEAAMRPARGFDGNPSQPATGSTRPNADLQADADADVPAMKAGIKSDGARSTVAPAHAVHAQSMAHAQLPAANASALMLLSQALTNLLPSGFGIEAAGEGARQMLATNAGETMGEISQNQQKQVSSSTEMINAVSQLLDEVLQQANSTAAHVIKGY